MKVYVVTRIRDGRKSVRLTPMRKSRREAYTQVVAELPDADARRIARRVADADAKS